MTIHYEGFVFDIDNSDLYKVSINLKLISNPEEILWECGLDGLWKDPNIRPSPELERIWSMHQKGDYFQQTLHRHNRTLHPHISYTAIFHELIRSKRKELSFINNIYSTSGLPWLSMGYSMYPPASNFWQKQTEARLALYIQDEKRYKALL